MPSMSTSVYDQINPRVLHPIVPDNSLNLWSHWMKKRRQQYLTLSAKTGRPPHHLVSSFVQSQKDELDGRLINEATRFMGYAKGYAHPNFWQTVRPPVNKTTRLENLIYPGNVKFGYHPNCIADKGYFGTPRAIMKEYGVEEYVTPDWWTNCEYLKRKKQELKSVIDVIEPFRPDIDSLCILGTAITSEKQPEPNLFQIPEIVITPPDDEPSDDIPYNLEDYRLSRPAFYIDNILVSPLDEDYNWIITFPKSEVNETQRYTMTFSNRGACVVFYQWMFIERYVNPTFPVTRNDEKYPRFSFYGSNGISIQGTEFELTFQFKSPVSGYYREIWWLVTKPKIRKTPIYVILQAIATAPKIKEEESCGKVQKYIEKRATESGIRKILAEIERGVKYPMMRAPYAEMFGENDLFEYNNPNLYYRTREVAELRELHDKFGSGRWNMSVLKLRNAVIEADLECNERNENLDELNYFVSELLNPPKEEKMEKMKHRMVYTVLCTFFNQMGRAASLLHEKFGSLPSIDVHYPPKVFDDRLLQWMVDNVRTEPTPTMSEKQFKASGAKKSVAVRKTTKVPTERKKSTSKDDMGRRKSSKTRQVRIWLTDPPQRKSQFESLLKENITVFTSALEAYTKDLLAVAIDKVCAVVDTTNAVEGGKQPDINVDLIAFHENWDYHYQRPPIPDIK